MKQLAEITRQSAETARQTMTPIKEIVDFASELDGLVKKITESGQEGESAVGNVQSVSRVAGYAP